MTQPPKASPRFSERELARHPTFKRLSGTDISQDTGLFDAVLQMDRSNMEPIMRASQFGNFPWEKRIKGLVDRDTVLFGAFSDSALVGYLELHPHRLGNNMVYISSLQISQDFRRTGIFVKLLQLAAMWFRDQTFSGLTTEVQVANPAMVSMLRRMGFTFHDGKHPHTRHATLSGESLRGNRILARVAEGGQVISQDT